MLHLPTTIVVRLQKFVTCVLLAVMVYQLGACPCGCWEHNSWLQMMGLSDHQHPIAEASDDVSVHDPGHHDCTGEHAPEYFDNAQVISNRASGGAKRPGVDPHLAVPARQLLVSSACGGFDHLALFDSRRHGCAPARSVLQVYQL